MCEPEGSLALGRREVDKLYQAETFRQPSFQSRETNNECQAYKLLTEPLTKCLVISRPEQFSKRRIHSLNIYISLQNNPANH